MTNALDQLILLDEMEQLTASAVKELFPDFDENDVEYDSLVSEVFVEEYAHQRSSGLSPQKTCHYMGYSSTLISTLLTGKGLSLGRFVALARAELFADAKFQSRNLEILQTSAASGGKNAWKVAASLLETITVSKDRSDERKFVGCPTLLSLAERQELRYRYQYLEDTVERLAMDYLVEAEKVTEWLAENKIDRKTLDTDEDIEAFEIYVNTMYKALQVRMMGVTALNTAKSWESLAASEEALLMGLKNAAYEIAGQKDPNAKIISALADTHDKLTSKHALIKDSVGSAEGIIAALKATAGWEIEVTHVDFKPKQAEKPKYLEKEDDDE